MFAVTIIAVRTSTVQAKCRINIRGGLVLKLPPRYTGQRLLLHVSPLVENDRAELSGMRNKSNSR
jgi:hypothetical protein